MVKFFETLEEVKLLQQNLQEHYVDFIWNEREKGLPTVKSSRGWPYRPTEKPAPGNLVNLPRTRRSHPKPG